MSRTIIIIGVNKVRGKVADGMTPQENGELVNMGSSTRGEGPRKSCLLSLLAMGSAHEK